MLNRSRSKQTNNVNIENLAFASVDSNRDTVDGSFDQRFATLKNIGEDRVNDLELKLLLKKKLAPHLMFGVIPLPGCTFPRYNIEMWKATGMALDEVELVWLSDEISRHGDEYWPLVMDIARKNSVRRIRRYCGSRDQFMMGQLTVAEMFRPCLQSAGILFQKADIWLLGMDQHDVNLLAKQYCKHIKRKSMPIAVLHNMLPNLLQYPARENRRHPAWAIFMEDDKPVHNHFGSTEAKDLVKAIKEYYVAD